MSFVNSIIAVVLDAALSPFRGFPPLVGIAVVAAVSAGAMLLVVKATSDQARLAAVKRSIQACVFEIRLFGDDAGAIFRALGELLRHQATYVRLSLIPLLWMALPFGLLLVHLDDRYGVGQLPPGKAALVKVRMRSPASQMPRLSVPGDLRIETPGVWIPSLREAVWRVSAEKPGRYDLTITNGDASVTKEFTTATGILRRTRVRPDGGVLDQLRYPGEPPVPADGGVESITVTYPARSIGVLGWEVHWLVVLFVLTMAFAFVLRSPMRVVF